MKNTWSKEWKSSKQKRKQIKYRTNAPDHIRGRFISSHLSKDLIKKYNKRSIRLRTGDKVKIMNGQFKGKTVKVEKIDTKTEHVYLTGIEIIKKDGTKRLFPIDASNLMITELNLDDKKRRQKVEGNKPEVKTEAKKEAPKTEVKEEKKEEVVVETKETKSFSESQNREKQSFSGPRNRSISAESEISVKKK